MLNIIEPAQLAFYSDRNSLLFNFYRNAVNKERKSCKAAYYASKVQKIKGVNQRKW